MRFNITTYFRTTIIVIAVLVVAALIERGLTCNAPDTADIVIDNVADGADLLSSPSADVNIAGVTATDSFRIGYTNDLSDVDLEIHATDEIHPWGGRRMATIDNCGHIYIEPEYTEEDVILQMAASLRHQPYPVQKQ